MKSYEIIVMLVLVFMGVIIVTNVLSVERPSLTISEDDYNGISDSSVTCYLTVSAKVTNLGGPAKSVVLKANVIGQTGNLLASRELEAGELDKKQFSVVNGEISVNKPCSEIKDVVFSISSFS